MVATTPLNTALGLTANVPEPTMRSLLGIETITADLTGLSLWVPARIPAFPFVLGSQGAIVASREYWCLIKNDTDVARSVIGIYIAGGNSAGTGVIAAYHLGTGNTIGTRFHRGTFSTASTGFVSVTLSAPVAVGEWVWVVIESDVAVTTYYPATAMRAYPLGCFGGFQVLMGFIRGSISSSSAGPTPAPALSAMTSGIDPGNAFPIPYFE